MDGCTSVRSKHVQFVGVQRLALENSSEARVDEVENNRSHIYLISHNNSGHTFIMLFSTDYVEKSGF